MNAMSEALKRFLNSSKEAPTKIAKNGVGESGSEGSDDDGASVDDISSSGFADDVDVPKVAREAISYKLPAYGKRK